MTNEELIAIAVKAMERNNSLLHQVRKLSYEVYHMPLVIDSDGETITTMPNVCYGYSTRMDNFIPVSSTYRTAICILNPKKIERVEKTKIGRFLTKLLDGKNTPDHKIRETAERLRMALDPEGLKKFVIFPDTIESYYKMFDMNNGSCLQVGTNHYGDAVAAHWEKMHKHHNMHPGAWLLYNPCLQGVYMINGEGKTIARAVLYMKDGTPVEFDYAKGIGANPFVLEMILFNNVIKKHDNNTPGWANREPFTIPGVRIPDENEVFFPWPTLDPPVNMEGLHTAYDPDTESLRVANSPTHPHFEGRRSQPALYRYDYKGFARASAYQEFKRAA